MEKITLIGIAASIFTAVSLLPQLVKMIQERKATDISMLMLLSLFIGLSLWVYYGMLKKDWILLISNAVSLFLNMMIFFFNLYYKSKHKGINK